jgi:hypothetical protein
MMPFPFSHHVPRAGAPRTGPMAHRLIAAVRQLLEVMAPNPMRRLSNMQLADFHWALESAVRRATLDGEHAARAAEMAPTLRQIEREMRRRRLR